MRLTSLRSPGGPRGALATERGVLALTEINRVAGTDWPQSVEGLVNAGRVAELRSWLANGPRVLADVPALAPSDVRPAPLLLRPPKILGVGLNYEDHAGDLGETRPTEPATFMKPATTILGAGEPIPIPRQSERTTGEAELGLIVGARCKDVSEADAPSVLAGVTTILDMTAEDILQRNPRFLTRAKSFDGFLVLGPDLVTVDEIGDLAAVQVTTLHNGAPHRRNLVANMMFSPWRLVAFFSQVMTLEPGDVISTGTPGAVVLGHGDTVGCEVTGIGAMECPVVDLKDPRSA